MDTHAPTAAVAGKRRVENLSAISTTFVEVADFSLAAGAACVGAPGGVTQIDLARISAGGFNSPRHVSKPTFRGLNRRQRFHSLGVFDMGFRFSRLATGVLVAAAVVLMSSRCWAVYYALGPSKDEWGLKYEGQVTVTKEGKLNVQFTLADEGRLKSIHSVHIFASTPPDSYGSSTYLLKAGMPMKPTADGKMAGELQIGRELADVAVVRIFSYTVDGQPQKQGVRYYDIPLKNLVKKAPVAAAPRAPASSAPSSRAPLSIASPPSSKVTR